jgi:hypothetical protein
VLPNQAVTLARMLHCIAGQTAAAATAYRVVVPQDSVTVNLVEADRKVALPHSL